MKNKVKKIIDCKGENCPMPLIKTREAVMEAEKGDIIEIVGTHEQSFEEIPMALEALGIEILEKNKNGVIWNIIFKV